MIALEEFLQLPTCEVAKLVQDSGPKVVVFPINGTRRWFMLEHGQKEWDDPVSAYMTMATIRHIELYTLFFEHGIETLVTPVIGAEILATRGSYMQQIGAEGLARLATHQDFLSFYEEFDVRVRFYGDYRKSLAGTPYEYLSDTFAGLAQATKHHKRYRLFLGAFADQRLAIETISEFAIQYYTEYGKIPGHQEIIEMYYGEYVAKADIFIGFDRFSVFDYPLLNWGEEDLYFTIAPSTYMTDTQLRSILYDHLFSRRIKEIEYMSGSINNLQALRKYYKENAQNTLGTGQIIDGVWAPKLL